MCIMVYTARSWQHLQDLSGPVSVRATPNYFIIIIYYYLPTYPVTRVYIHIIMQHEYNNIMYNNNMCVCVFERPPTLITPEADAASAA